MIQESVTFEDLDGNDVTETFYFHLSKIEMVEREVTADGGSLVDLLEKIVEEKDNAQLFHHFKEFIAKAVGTRAADGRRFIKTQELTDYFIQSDAYSELAIKLMSDENYSAKFISEVVPRSIRENLPEAKKMVLQGVPVEIVELPQPPRVEPPANVSALGVREQVEKEVLQPVAEQLNSMTLEQLKAALAAREQ